MSVTKNLYLSMLGSITVGCFMLSGCQHAIMPAKLTAPVIPKENNTFDTYGEGETKNAALKDAMHNTQVTCSNKNTPQRPIVIHHNTTYHGLTNEKTDSMISKVGKILVTVSGQNIPKTQSKSDYQVTMSFKCVK